MGSRLSPQDDEGNDTAEDGMRSIANLRRLNHRLEGWFVTNPTRAGLIHAL